MARWSDQHHPRVRHFCNRQSLTMFGVSENTKLNRPAEDVTQDPGRSRVFEIDLGRRELGHELTHFLRQLVKADTVNRRDLDRTTYLSDNASQTLLQVIVRSEDTLALAVKHLSGGR